MATANASVPAFNKTYINPTVVTNLDITTATQVIVPDDTLNLILEEDYFIQDNNDSISIVTYLAAGRYRFLSLRFQSGWSRYSFFAVLLGMPPTATHEEIEAAVLSATGQTVDEAWPVYGPAYVPAGINEGDAAQVYNNAPGSSTGLVGLDTLTCYAQFNAAINPGTDWRADILYMNTGGGYPSTFGNTGIQSGSNLLLADQDTFTINGTPNAIPPADVAYSIVFEVSNNSGISLAVTGANVHIEYPAQDFEWVYTDFFPDGVPPVNEPVLAISGNRYGLTDRNHGFAVNPRKSRG